MLTYAELDRCLKQGLAELNEAGMVAGTRLVLDDSPGTIEWVVTLLAGLAAGLQLILPDSAWDASEIAGHIEPLRPAGTLTIQEHFRGMRFPSEQQPPPQIRGALGGVWHFTSGTTKRPRPHFRSTLTLRRMVNRLKERLPDAIVRSQPRSLCMAPISHGYGLINGLLLPHAVGATVTIPGALTSEKMGKQLQGIDALYGWPMHYRMLIEHAEGKGQYDRSLKWCVSSSFPIDSAVSMLNGALTKVHPS